VKNVREIVEAKGKDIWVTSPETKVFDALKLMADKSVGALLVVEKGEVVGILSERDYARKVILKGKSSMNIPVREIMTSRVYGVTLDTKVEECMALMTEKRIRHLPVYEQDRLVGLVSIGDVVKSILSEQKVMIEHLTDFIMGKYV
jgi:CBS domain-containing protein